MFQRKSSPAPAGPVKQLDLDICLALTGKPPVINDSPDGQVPAEPVQAEPQQWLTFPTSRNAMRLFVKQVQSRVVQVSDLVKARMVEASAQMSARIIEERPAQRRKAG